MIGLPVVTPRQLIRALERAGFFVHHVKGVATIIYAIPRSQGCS
jgi:predicted RNA binding protein YcfA (HicA-like mRNA interferase family)